MRASGKLRLVAFILVFAAGCAGKVSMRFATADDFIITEDERTMPSGIVSPCSDPMNYLPDTTNPNVLPLKYVQVRMHFMNDLERTCNFSEADGVTFARQVIDGCNKMLANNAQMHLPAGNETPVLPINYRLHLTPSEDDEDGIYFHYDPGQLTYYVHGRNTNRSDRDVFEKYALAPDSVINIFFMPHHPDSVGRPGYRAVGTGITLGTNIKIAQVFNDRLPPESCQGLLNHEIGHVFGLRHTWRGNDGCEDTPNHDNCFSYTRQPPCDSVISNNMMDYNQWQRALTPCQVGKVHRAIANRRSRIRKCVRQDWCTYDPDRRVRITGHEVWRGEKDLYGDIMIEDGGHLEINCRVSLPAGASIYIAPDARLILTNALIHNACGNQWEGIRIMTRRDQEGVIEMSGSSEILDARHSVAMESESSTRQ